MPDEPKQDEAPIEQKKTGNTLQLDRLERLANAASASQQARQWSARRNGLRNDDSPSDVRDMSHDADAKAQAEEAMRRMLEKPNKKPTRRW